MVDLKKRAQRRQEHWESKLADPSQLVRASGYKCPIFTDPHGYKIVNSGEVMLNWLGDGMVSIDRFDGRALLDYLPNTQVKGDDNPILNFERYRSLVDHSRRGVSESQCLDEINEKWNQITRRETMSQPKPSTMFSYNYEGTTTVASKAIDHLADTENLEKVADKLSDRDFSQLDKIGERYGIIGYSSRLFPQKARYISRNIKPSNQPTASSSTEQQECVIEFTGEAPVEIVNTVRPTPRFVAPPEKKLTLLERMQLQVRQGLNKTIRHQKELNQKKDKRQEVDMDSAYITSSAVAFPKLSPGESSVEQRVSVVPTKIDKKISVLAADRERHDRSKSPKRRQTRNSSRSLSPRREKYFSRSRSHRRISRRRSPSRSESPRRDKSPSKYRRSRSISRSPSKYHRGRSISRSPRRHRNNANRSPRRYRERSFSRSRSPRPNSPRRNEHDRDYGDFKYQKSRSSNSNRASRR